MPQTVSVELILLSAALAGFAGALAYLYALSSRQKRENRITKAISASIVDYFRRTGVEVSVGCVATHRGKRFTAFVESEPMKRFRLSHIIEMTLREQVSKSVGVELDKVYWRFPIKQVAEGAAAPDLPREKEKKVAGGEHHDDYINEGLVNYRDLPKVEVTEIPWETFEEAAAQDTVVKPDENGKPGSPA